VTENEAIARSADMLTACIPQAIGRATGKQILTSLAMVNAMMSSLDHDEMRLVLAVMTAFASRLIQIQSEGSNLAPEDIVLQMRRIAV
jgi:hypothetical protein